MEINLNKSLSELDKNLKPNNSEISNLVKKHNQILTKKLKDFDNEDYRFMISQNTGIEYLIPLAITILEDNIFAEGDFYEGDILQSILKINECFWKKDKKSSHKIYTLITTKLDFSKVEITEHIINNLKFLSNNYIGFYLEEFLK